VSEPAVTVLMSVYNDLPRLPQAIDSILAQTFTDFEFLVVDDGSTDGSAAYVRRRGESDPRIRLLAQDGNRGLGATLRIGVEAARGKFVARMDADDESVPHRLERQLRHFDANPETDLLGSFAMDVAPDGSILRERRVPLTPARIAELVWTNPFVHSSVMFRRDSIRGIGSYDASLRRRQDYDLWFRCVHAGLVLANLPEALVRYRYAEDTVQRAGFAATWDQVRIGLRGCRLVGAPLLAYVGVCAPLVESALPRGLRMWLQSVKARIDPRSAA
jgi:glycosyltransferase involved in cell wall biosynthesis